MVVAELLEIKDSLYIYEYRPWDDEERGRGEFAMSANGELAGYYFFAKDDETKTYFEHAVIAIKSLYKKTGEMPPKASWVWM